MVPSFSFFSVPSSSSLHPHRPKNLLCSSLRRQRLYILNHLSLRLLCYITRNDDDDGSDDAETIYLHLSYQSLGRTREECDLHV